MNTLVCLFNCGQGTVALFYVGLSVVGISFGSFMGVYPGFTADQFGPTNNSVNYGIMFIGFALAGYFGPQIMRNIYAANNAYANAFISFDVDVGLNVVSLEVNTPYSFSYLITIR